MLLLFLVLADLRLFVGRGSRFGGVAIGLATAVKLTPGIFILYLLLTRKYRAALTAIATSAAATVLAMLVAPQASREFWTDALWDTDRVGVLSFISNQSLEGFVVRLHQQDPSMALWALLVLVTLGFWAWRVRRCDEATGVALTGVTACLVSPVTWVHHMVWLLPALLLLFDRALAARGRVRAAWLGLCIGLYALLSSRVIWSFAGHYAGWGFIMSNAYVLASVILLIALPSGSGDVAGVPELREVDDGAVGPADGVARPGAVQSEAGPLVEASGAGVVRENP
jgi:alpha-1,2-mannosyltransferase